MSQERMKELAEVLMDQREHKYSIIVAIECVLLQRDTDIRTFHKLKGLSDNMKQVFNVDWYAYPTMEDFKKDMLYGECTKDLRDNIRYASYKDRAGYSAFLDGVSSFFSVELTGKKKPNGRPVTIFDEPEVYSYHSDQHRFVTGIHELVVDDKPMIMFSYVSVIKLKAATLHDNSKFLIYKHELNMHKEEIKEENKDEIKEELVMTYSDLFMQAIPVDQYAYEGYHNSLYSSLSDAKANAKKEKYDDQTYSKAYNTAKDVLYSKLKDLSFRFEIVDEEQLIRVVEETTMASQDGKIKLIRDLVSRNFAKSKFESKYKLFGSYYTAKVFDREFLLHFQNGCTMKLVMYPLGPIGLFGKPMKVDAKTRSLLEVNDGKQFVEIKGEDGKA